ncbi:MAG: DNA-directed RNA polymerase subunit omega [bacterium]|nr:DNA-directed RNA polymerase subunit omega [bacterium]
MLYDIERLLVGVENRFKLVNILAERAKELGKGAVSEVESETKKIIPIALQEKLDGKIEYKEYEE